MNNDPYRGLLKRTFGENRANRRPVSSKDATVYGSTSRFSIRSGDGADQAIIPGGKWNPGKLSCGGARRLHPFYPLQPE
jgi:hypothetical protein